MQQIPTEHLPKFHRDAFHCPRCKVVAPQTWHRVGKLQNRTTEIFVDESNIPQGKSIGSRAIRTEEPSGEPGVFIKEWHLEISVCSHCYNYSVWENHNIIFPFTTDLPEPNEDMPKNIKGIYREAMGCTNILLGLRLHYFDLQLK